jgi:hypothetical protein
MSTENSTNSFPALVHRAWSGALPLWQIFWLGLFLVTLALSGFLRFFVIDLFSPFSVKDAVLFFFLLAFPILAFLWVAVWRSAAKSSRRVSYSARAIVLTHAVWFSLKFVRFLSFYGSLA